MAEHPNLEQDKLSTVIEYLEQMDTILQLTANELLLRNVCLNLCRRVEILERQMFNVAKKRPVNFGPGWPSANEAITGEFSEKL